MERMKVRDIMSTELVTLEQDEDIELAESVMSFSRIRHLPVVQGEKLVGLITHRDILRAQVSSLAELSPDESLSIHASIQARDIMQTNVRTIGPDASVLDAAKILKKNKFGCLPVVEDHCLVGIVTEADFIDLVIRFLDKS